MDAVIVTEGSNDVEILKALLTRQSHRTQGPWNWQIEIVPAIGEPGGRDNIPNWVKRYVKYSKLIIVIFDPDDKSYSKVIRQIFRKILKNLNASDDKQERWEYLAQESRRLSTQIGLDARRIRVIQTTEDGKVKRVLLAFWPAQVQSLKRAHSMLDYILVLLRQENILKKVLKDLQQVRADERISARKIIEKHDEILKLLQDQNIRVSSSKRELDFLKALVGFREGYGKMGAKIIRNKLISQKDLESVFGDMIDFIEKLLAFVQSGQWANGIR
ncbi:hypothetical protein [Thermoflexus sp.]|uniref:hypothetical protein n=1 Tax=Thermoflexus sp. TaxID=1969742 RepID=UPI0025D52590|nr:hypothetical protein [Thermoflexus sp.]MCS7351983.1 hypothetical protein [Thermoflexus sp.]MDW8181442.1 hypothetical protein [Anaerolineae bacterium]